MRRTKKRWIKPMLKSVPIFFECTCYAGRGVIERA